MRKVMKKSKYFLLLNNIVKKKKNYILDPYNHEGLV